MSGMVQHRPDILLIYTDQWRWDALGRLGSPAQTPVLDRLAADGVHFDHCVVQSPVCMPSRVSMLTGRYPSNLGITQMGVPVPADTETVATVLARRGWRTANIGKLHFQPHANREHGDPHPSYGFEVLALSDEPGGYEDDYRAWVRSIDPEALDGLSLALPPAAQLWQEAMGTPAPVPQVAAGAREDYSDTHTFPYASELTHSAWVATRTIEHLESLSEGEAGSTIASFFSPHAPYYVPREFLDLYQRDELPLPELTPEERLEQQSRRLDDDRLRTIRHGYFAAISEVDHHIGRILDALDRLGRAENTVVVFVSDHGEWLGDHLRLAKGYPADDPVSRVPLIFRWPADIDSPGRTVSSVVEALDVMPTLLSAVGVPVPTSGQGRSLLPALQGQSLDRETVGITEHAGWRSVRTADYRYVIHADGHECFWHLAVDPGGNTDVSADPAHQAALANHRRLLLQRQLQAERDLPRVWPY